MMRWSNFFFLSLLKLSSHIHIPSFSHTLSLTLTTPLIPISSLLPQPIPNPYPSQLDISQNPHSIPVRALIRPHPRSLFTPNVVPALSESAALPPPPRAPGASWCGWWREKKGGRYSERGLVGCLGEKNMKVARVGMRRERFCRFLREILRRDDAKQTAAPEKSSPPLSLKLLFWGSLIA